MDSGANLALKCGSGAVVGTPVVGTAAVGIVVVGTAVVGTAAAPRIERRASIVFSGVCPTEVKSLPK